MTQDTDTPRIAAWKLILEQIETLQARMEELGIQAVVDHYSTEDGIAGLQGSEFINGCANRIHLPEHDFGEAPAMVSIRATGQDEELVVHPFDGIVSMQDAAAQIFDNICEYVYATGDPDAVIDGFDLRLEAKGGIDIQVLAERAEPWTVPGVTQTERQISGWFDREIDRLTEELTDRFTEVLGRRLQEISTEHGGIALTALGGHGRLTFKIEYEGRMWNFDTLRVEELEEAYPGLSEQVEALQDTYCALDGRLTVSDFETVRIRRPEPLEPDNDDEPGM